jgi:hypothetical protein
MFYVNTRANEIKILTLDEVKKEIINIITNTNNDVNNNNNNKIAGVIIPSTIHEKVLDYYGYKKVIVKENKSLLITDKDENIVELYHNKRYTKPVININGDWECNVIYELDHNKISFYINEKRNIRDKLLKETDWIAMSNIVTDKTRKRYERYRTLLRLSMDNVTFPHDIVFPTKPLIEYTKEYLDCYNKSKTFLTEEQIEKIKTHKPGSKYNNNWNCFLQEWKKCNFDKRYSFVTNLLGIYMDSDNYETIIGI